MNQHAQADVLVIGIGNLYCGDDGVGRLVAQELNGRTTARVFEESGEGTALMDRWKNANAVVVIDAVRSGRAPGTIHRLDARTQEIPAEFFHYSTHAFSVAEAVEMARALGELPPQLIIFGIEGKNFQAGAGFSPEVVDAAREVERRIRQEIEELKTTSKRKVREHARVLVDQ